MTQACPKFKPRAKKCKMCRTEFYPFKILQSVCSPRCAEHYAKEKARREVKHDIKQAKQALKTRSEHLKDCQAVVNRYIRLRDEKLPCISCGRYHTGQYHAGHYRSVGAMPSLRFNELNIHKQCSACNNHLSGNIVNYRINLIVKIGVDKVEWLEGNHEPLKLTIPEILALKVEYRVKIKALDNKK